MLDFDSVTLNISFSALKYVQSLISEFVLHVTQLKKSVYYEEVEIKYFQPIHASNVFSKRAAGSRERTHSRIKLYQQK